MTNNDLEGFVAEMLDSRSFFEYEGAGVIITIEPGKEDSRECPYKMKNIIRKGRCKLTRIVQLFLKSNNQLIGECSTKGAAMIEAKRLMSIYKEDIYAKTLYRTKKDDFDFELEYVPSKHSKIGKYIVFGVDIEDVRIAKRKKRLNL